MKKSEKNKTLLTLLDRVNQTVVGFHYAGIINCIDLQCTVSSCAVY